MHAIVQVTEFLVISWCDFCFFPSREASHGCKLACDVKSCMLLNFMLVI